MIASEDLQRVYIGSTKNLVKRLQKHRSALRTNSHHSKYMQRYYNQGKLLYFCILEETSQLEDRELIWIKALNPKFNSIENTHSIFRDVNFIKKFTIPKSIKDSKKIYVFDTLGNFIREFNSISDAAKAYNTSRSNIKLSCNSINRTCKKHVFSFDKVFRYEKPDIGTQNLKLKSKLFSIVSKRIIRSDGIIYNSVTKAEITNNFCKGTLGYFIKNKRLRNGHLYEYIV